MKIKNLLFAAVVAAIGLVWMPAAFPAGSSATLVWNNATAYEDGSALAASEIKETLIQWYRPGSSNVVGSVRVAAPATTVVVPGLTCGNFEFTGVTVVKTNNGTSVETGRVAYATGIQCKPNPPSSLGVS